MKLAALFSILFMINSCSTGKFTSKLKEQENLTEIIEFKAYLKSIDFMDGFTKDITLREFQDEKINEFKEKYQINSIQIWNCKPYPYAYEHFKECGNLIILSNSNVPLAQDNHSLIFDYSEIGLELKDGVPAKHKIAEGIFLF